MIGDGGIAGRSGRTTFQELNLSVQGLPKMACHGLIVRDRLGSMNRSLTRADNYEMSLSKLRPSSRTLRRPHCKATKRRKQVEVAEAKLPTDGKTLDNMSHLMRHVPTSYFGHVKKFDDLTRVVGFALTQRHGRGRPSLSPNLYPPPLPLSTTTSSASSLHTPSSSTASTKCAHTPCSPSTPNPPAMSAQRSTGP